MAQFNWSKFQRYSTEDIEYKEQARQIICDALGFDVPIHVSVMSEQTIRQNLRKIANGELPNDALDKQIEYQKDFIIKTIIPKYAPELSHLIK